MGRRLAVLGLIVLCVLVAGAQDTVAGVWIPTDLHWDQHELAPKGLKMASAEVLYFGPRGEFKRDDCLLLRQSGHVTISNGDGHVEYEGNWQAQGSGAEVTYRLTRRTVEMKGEQLPGPELKDRAILKGNRLQFGGRTFQRLSGQDASEAERGLGVRKNADSH